MGHTMLRSPSRLRRWAALTALALASILHPAAVRAAGPEGQAVSFPSADGIRLEATWYAAKSPKPGAVLYLHMPARSSGDWSYLASMVAGHGIPGLALDLRGHGGSRKTVAGEAIDRDVFTPADWQAMSGDVAAAVAWLRTQRKVPADQIRIVGADFGASLALVHAQSDPGIRSLALLSPGLGYQGLNVKGKVGAFGGRPLLIAFSEEDAYAVKSGEVLAEEAPGRVLVQRYVGAGHGTRMLNREGTLEQTLLGWLLGTLGEDGRPVVLDGMPESERKTVETTEKRDLAGEDRKRIEAQKRQVKEDQEAIEEAEPEADGEPRRWE